MLHYVLLKYLLFILGCTSVSQSHLVVGVCPLCTSL